MRPFFVALCLAVGSCVSSGCNSSLFNQHVKDMEIMRGVAATVSERMGKGAIGQAAGSLQGQNPGVMVEFGTKYFCVARYDGVAGALTFSQQGTLDRELTPEQDALIAAILNDTTTTSATKRAQIMQVIQPFANKLAAQKVP